MTRSSIRGAGGALRPGPRPLHAGAGRPVRQGRDRRSHLARAVLAVDDRIDRGGGWRAQLRRDDPRHRALRPRRGVAQGRQGPADLEPAGPVQPPAGGRSADHRPYRLSAPARSVADAAARNQYVGAAGPGAADPARTAAQGDRQTTRGRSAFARRAGHRARGAAQSLRPGDAGAAVRRARPPSRLAAARCARRTRARF